MNIKKVNYCFSCGSEELSFNFKRLECQKCGAVYYHNVAASVAALIIRDNKLLVLVRNQDPYKGAYDLPGGFLDPDETAEAALSREIFEELGVKVSKLEILRTYPNVYEYGGISYNTCDIIFKVSLETYDFILDKEEIQAFKWVSLDKLNYQDFAFVSIKNALKDFLFEFKE